MKIIAQAAFLILSSQAFSQDSRPASHKPSLKEKISTSYQMTRFAGSLLWKHWFSVPEEKKLEKAYRNLEKKFKPLEGEVSLTDFKQRLRALDIELEVPFNLDPTSAETKKVLKLFYQNDFEHLRSLAKLLAELWVDLSSDGCVVLSNKVIFKRILKIKLTRDHKFSVIRRGDRTAHQYEFNGFTTYKTEEKVDQDTFEDQIILQIGLKRASKLRPRDLQEIFTRQVHMAHALYSPRRLSANVKNMEFFGGDKIRNAKYTPRALEIRRQALDLPSHEFDRLIDYFQDLDLKRVFGQLSDYSEFSRRLVIGTNYFDDETGHRFGGLYLNVEDSAVEVLEQEITRP